MSSMYVRNPENSIQYCCENCKKLFLKSKRHPITDTRILCSNCKTRETKTKLYGDPTYNNKDKNKETIKERYGSTKGLYQYKINNGYINPFSKPEVIEKLKETWLEKYGVDNPSKSPAIIQKIKDTYIERFGSVEAFYEYLKKENLKCLYNGYGKSYENWFQVPEIIEKCKKTSLENFGYEYGALCPEIRERMTQTLINHIKNYGRTSCNYKYLYNGISFDSSWELAIWIYCTDNKIPIIREPKVFSYLDEQGKSHLYFVDFMINDELVEVKGDNLKKDFESSPKYEIVKTNNIKVLYKKDMEFYLDYCKQNYGKDFLKSFRLKKELKIDKQENN